MATHEHSETRQEASEVLRWMFLFPAFAVLALLSANFTLGFFKWLLPKTGMLFVLMLPVALLVVLSNSLASFIGCMIAPRKRSAVVLLGIGHFMIMIWGYMKFEWASLPTFAWGAHALFVYLGLAAVYYLDRLHEQEVRRTASA